MNDRRELLSLGLRAGASLLAGGLAWPVWSKENPLHVLPLSVSLQDELVAALREQNPLIVMVSLEGCPFCKTARQSYLGPMLRDDKLTIVQVDMRSKRDVQDAMGKPTTHDDLVRGWKVRIAPTVLFLGAGGRELAPRLVGASLPDFYGAYLDQRLATARQALKAS